MLVTMGSLFLLEKSSRSTLGIDDLEPSNFLQDALNRAYTELPGMVSNQVPRPLFIRLASVLLREDFQDIHNAFVPDLELILAKLQNELPAIARSSHANALGEGLAPNKRVEALASLSWTVRSYARHSLILPDCVALTEFSDGGFGPFQIRDNEMLSRVLLPLSDHCLLVGEHDNAAPYSLTPEEFNRFASNSCWEFFIASTESEELITLAAEIGQRARYFLSAAIDNVKKDFTPLLDEQTTAVPGSSTLVETQNALLGRFAVSFLGCADEEKAKRVAGIVTSIAQAVGQQFPLNRLDTVTFAHDYVGTLHVLDRGHPQLRALAPTEDACGIGIAMAPLVVRDGQIRVCVVMRSWLSNALLSEEESARSTAIHTLVGMMARAAFVEMLDTALPGTLLTPLPDAWNAFLFQQVEDVFSAYFSARVAAPCMPEIGDNYRTLFCDVLKRADFQIPKDRLTYRTDGNLDEFLGSVAKMISPVLIHCATLIGHFDGLEETPFDEEGNLSSALQGAGLGHWFEVYGTDLRKNHDRIGTWSSLKEFMFLTAHVERHHWRYGIFPWRSEDGTVRIEVPLITDAAALGL
jgi:2'-5' RNA ligase